MDVGTSDCGSSAWKTLRAGKPRNRGSISCRGKKLFSKTPKSAQGLTEPSVQWVWRSLSLGVRKLGCEVDHLVPRLRMRGAVLTSPPRFHVVHSDSFTLATRFQSLLAIFAGFLLLQLLHSSASSHFPLFFVLHFGSSSSFSSFRWPGQYSLKPSVTSYA